VLRLDEAPKPVVDIHIWTVALDMRSKASRQASAGGHFSIRSPRTEVAARIVKSTSSIVCEASQHYSLTTWNKTH
jgi:hypothetical protein